MLGVRQATQFKGAFKGHSLSLIDDTLKMVPDHVFKLDDEFDFLITAQHVYILRPDGFRAAARAREMTLELSRRPDYTGLRSGNETPTRVLLARAS